MNAKTAALTLALLPALAGARDLGPGTWELSGGTNLDFGKTTSSRSGASDLETTVVSVDTDGLYYPVKNLGIGLGLGYDRSESDSGVYSSESSTSVIGPQAKLSIPFAPQASVLLSGAVGRMWVRQETNDLPVEHADGWLFVGGAGVRMFPADFVALDVTVNYMRGSIDYEDLGAPEVDMSGWDLGLAISVFFGGR